ncbi:MAG: hypothetical protein WCI02_15130 [Planctomycetota bacterium]
MISGTPFGLVSDLFRKGIAEDTVQKKSQDLNLKQPNAPKFSNPIEELPAARDRAVMSF